MRWEDAVLKAIEETADKSCEANVICLAILLRADQLTTDTSKCEKCGGGG